MVVGLKGKEPHLRPDHLTSYCVRLGQPDLDAMVMSHSLIEASEDVEHVPQAIGAAHAKSKPQTFLIGHSPEVK